MGVNYTDDISQKQLDSSAAYRMEFTKFEGDKMTKSKVFYVGLESIKSIIGTTDLQWKVSQKNQDGKYIPLAGNP